MTDSRDPHDDATPYMRRLAASMARSGEAMRTLPGRLSRSLAPTGGSRRRRELLLMLVAVLPFAIALIAMNGRGGYGTWTIVDVGPPPWQPDAGVGPELRALIGQTVAFERDRVRAPSPLDCTGARYQEVEQPPEGLFQGALAERPDAAAQAATLGFAGSAASTLSIACDNATFDYHRVGDAALIMVSGAVLRLVER